MRLLLAVAALLLSATHALACKAEAGGWETQTYDTGNVSMSRINQDRRSRLYLLMGTSKNHASLAAANLTR
jgi:hypothetical protein